MTGISSIVFRVSYDVAIMVVTSAAKHWLQVIWVCLNVEVYIVVLC